MKEDNKKFINAEDFYHLVIKAMKYKGISSDELYQIIRNDIGYDISKNNLSVYLQRIPNANFLIALSKALGVSTDYLLGLNQVELNEGGFNYQYNSPRFRKYIHTNYNLYYASTVSSKMEAPENRQAFSIAHLSINQDISYYATLTVPTSDGGAAKEYKGKLYLSSSYDVAYVMLKSTNFGEMVFMSFCDPNFNNNNADVEALVGTMISISAGDFKRVPVMSRFILTKDDIPESKYDAIYANLLLNTKYIYISETELNKVFESKQFSTAESNDVLLNRIKSAFNSFPCYRLEESYILNTLADDYGINSQDAFKLINVLRMHSEASVNNKANRAVDSKLYKYLTADSDCN